MLKRVHILNRTLSIIIFEFKIMDRDTITLNKSEAMLFDLISSAIAKIPKRKSNESVYVFGGWVRDKLLGKPSKDYDVLVSKPILKDFVKHISNCGHKVSVKQIKLDEYPKIGQVLHNINIKDIKVKLGVTALEIDLEQELASKDFTINSLCYDLVSRSLVRNRVTAQGRSDLAQKILRTNASIELTLRQAPSRVIRMVRFALEYRFRLADEILRYFDNTKLRQVVKYYSNSFFNQLRKLARFVDLETDKTSECLVLLDRLRVLNLVTLWFDYRARRIVIFFVKHDLTELKAMMKKDQLVPGDHYVVIRLELRALLSRHQQYILIKNKRNPVFHSQ